MEWKKEVVTGLMENNGDDSGDNMVSNVLAIKEAVEKRKAIEAGKTKEQQSGVDAGITSSFIRRCLRANELGDGILYAALNQGKYIFCQNMDHWLIWDGHHWAIDVMERAHYAVEAVVEKYLEETGRIYELSSKKNENPDESLVKELYQRIKRLRSGIGRKSCLAFAHQCENPISIRGDEMDTKPWKLPCRNGVIDLETGLFASGIPGDLLMKAANSDWAGLDCEAPTWEKALLEIFSENEDLVEYIQRLFGYAITGNDFENIFPVFCGQGRNGKSMIVNVISTILGDLASPIQSDMLLDQGKVRSSGAPSPDIMSLKGLRIAFASETDMGSKISTSKVKWLTGGDELIGRAPHDKYETKFKPTHTLFLLTNNKPHAPADDYAFWKRVHLIPFLVSFVRDPKEPNERLIDMALPKKLIEERAGILSWLVRGCLQWQREGLNPPPIVREATAEYRRDEDLLADFLDECCIINQEYHVGATDLYKAFAEWWKESVGRRPPSQKTFGRLVGGKFNREKRGGVYRYFGVGLAAEFVGGP